MRPDEGDLDDEIRGHLALSVHERVAQGADPEVARLAALRELGYLPAVRESMRRVWRSRWIDALSDFGTEVRIGVRSVMRARGLALAVVATLALGIGANAAIVSLVRGVLLRPLVNRDENRLVYIRQTAPDSQATNLTFSVPEIRDLESQVGAIEAFGEFSTTGLTMVGIGEPRAVRAGVVNGAYFAVVGLRPVLGRLLDASDDRPESAGAAVLTHRFWSTVLHADPAVVGRTIGLGPRTAIIVGVLEPSVPYPVDTEIIANVVTSPHHLQATMVTERTHRMTELFGRLRPGVTVEAAQAELGRAHEAMMRAHPAAYASRPDARVTVTPLREAIAAPARMVLFVLLAAAALVFAIACSNVANLILSRSLRRENELAIRAALGASRGALRRTLLVESVALCAAGAALGVVLARPFLAIVSRYAARFSPRALDVRVDGSLLAVGVGLAMIAAILLAYVPRLPSTSTPAGPERGGFVRTGPGRRMRVLAVAQIGFSFVLLAGAGALLATLVALQNARTAYDMNRVLAVDVPPAATGIFGSPVVDYFEQAIARIAALPGVEGAAAGTLTPWRDQGAGLQFTFGVEGQPSRVDGGSPRGHLRVVSPDYFRVLGVPLLAGRHFADADDGGAEPVVIVSESLAREAFPGGDAMGGRLFWTDPVLGAPMPRRIVGIVADADDQNIVAGPALTVYHPLRQMMIASRLFVRTTGDPYQMEPAVTAILREISASQAVERIATLADVRASVLSPERASAFVFTGFAIVALLVAVVGVSGVLAFSVSARTREFGVRLAIGSTHRRLLLDVLSEGTRIVSAGILSGAVGGAVCAWTVRRFLDVDLPGALPIVAAASLLAALAILASLIPAARASRVDVLRALRTE